ncbi:exostosin-2 [Macrosteles quadrilineatus]|uniref:exostosin-2 n=1 Tax=Macrosteles quadrilineatus TaxID=74068 RepID=UPI0023E2C795|nr:exostosin-2 [Macrosteles quadrilineatus]
MGQKQTLVVERYRHFFIIVLFVIILSFVFIIFALLNIFSKSLYSNSNTKLEQISFDNLQHIPEIVLTKRPLISGSRNYRCSYYDCFNVYRCGRKGADQISVYVYPFRKYVDESGSSVGPQMSKEYFTILKTIVKSKYYTPDPEEACILVPSIDTLNQNRLRLKEISQALGLLPYWYGGENHLIWNMIPGSPPEYNTVVDLSLGNALVAGAGFDSWTYRVGFDISLPVYSPSASTLDTDKSGIMKRKWLVISSQVNIHPEYSMELQGLAETKPQLLVLEPCPGQTNTSLRCAGPSNTVYHYPEILQEGSFCLVLRGARLGQPTLLEALAAGCIPIVAADTMVMPFADVIDWKRAALFVGEADLNTIVDLAAGVSPRHREEMSEQGLWLYKKYFSSVEALTLTVLDIVNDRVFPHHAKVYEDWNFPNYKRIPQSPLFLPLTAPRGPGFTAVILTYDRVESLFTLINKLITVPSLSKVIVVWNHQKKHPPPSHLWPKVNKPVKLIRTKENKLSNRFYPYEEIETEAILTIDDDIMMLTADELEFGFEVWREFPDRIVGFPSRTHVWDNSTQRWKYESEWTNQISMVLTGVAFHHKYWSYLYTTAMPGDIKEWVDSHMNCEDIAMNFLVANITNKAPIKVTPRKKFKCPECVNTEMLSLDLSHMVERSECINRFTSIYGYMPLHTVEFRADPVLYKDSFPEKLKRFNDIGSL